MSPADAAPPPERSLSLLSLTTPVAMGYIPLGMVFGFLFVQAGGAAWLAVLSSIVVYAGAAQYMMVPMLAAGLPVGAIALATAVVNLRHVFYGLSLLDRLPDQRGLRWILAFCLTDETYSVLTALPRSTPGNRLMGVALLNQGWWTLGTALGALLGSQVPLNLQGLDFVLAALFGVLTVEQWRQRDSAAPLWTALAAYAVAQAVAPAHALVIAIALSLVVGLVWPGRPRAASLPEHQA
ncbi:AzlC family ABC transporter permease [Ideonella oryzae]|uniref:AzlC family ABC transporter permease n=1 Tax=Ideonella oryzae TaxID=2937441 RepID=A0ABT1BHA4_9BURK|nr:AzlC family ABC transporter permease [Ideonella oryzae]MCO5975602.1 AzlC family ABC transporter permease [Ideonella oryzae]